MTTDELATLRGLMNEADSCFNDLRKLGAISRPNAINYRKHREAARQILAAYDAMAALAKRKTSATFRAVKFKGKTA